MMRLVLYILLVAPSMAAAFVSHRSPRCLKSTGLTRRYQKPSDDDDDDAWDADVDYDKVFPSDPNQDKSPDPTLGWEVPLDTVPTPKLGIDIGALLEPLSEKEAAELKAAATEVINEAVAAGIDEIETVRAKMKKELEFQRRQMQRQSERNMEQASASLLSRIDSITDAFLANTTLARTSTKLAAQADRAMEGRGVDMGTWGTIGGATVVAGSTSLGAAGFGASMAPIDASTTTTTTPAAKQPQENRLLVIADTKGDDYAKKLIGPLTKELEQVLSTVEVQTLKPTETIPLGGNNAAAVLFFLTSLSDVSSVKNGLERIMRQTMSASGQLAQPPTQIIAISTVGTARTNQMPYSMQNLFSGQLGKRKQMEEAIQSFVENGEKARDFTIVKLGELKDQINDDFALAPGDVLDGALDVDSAVAALKQAIALQPAARNATFCSVGDSASDTTQEVWDDLFLQLDGPEIWRCDLDDNDAGFDQLVEYIMEWSELPATSKGLTTPIRLERSTPIRPMGVTKQRALQFLYLPTATGDRYMSKDEERAREREMDSGGTKSSTTTTPPRKKSTKEGGLEILLEVTESPKVGMRVRARRCNYGPGVVIKELTEETLLSRIKKTIDVWQNEISPK